MDDCLRSDPTKSVCNDRTLGDITIPNGYGVEVVTFRIDRTSGTETGA